MPDYWWVNHKQTARQEIDGQYLWSPKTQKNGARNVFYENMRRASPGDFVLSYFDQAIRFVGRIAEFAFAAPKPEEFGDTGSNWNNDGWLLPVYWTPLSAPVRPKLIIELLAPMLPRKYSPIRAATGAGNQGAYLASIPLTVFELIVSQAEYDHVALMQGGANSLTFELVKELLDDAVERQIRTDLQLDATVKRSVIEARRGQGKFRRNVEAIENACRLTGIINPSLLIASHIKPWRVCETAEERLDGMNGLMLTPDADLLFDRGFISFEDSGEVLVSPRVNRGDLRRLGFDQLAMERFGVAEAPMVWGTGPFLEAQCSYLSHHRSAVFIA